jgi:hypothetical protein
MVMGQLRRLQEQAGELTVSAASDDELIHVHATGAGEVRLELRTGALRGRSEPELEAKINRVIDEAMWQLRVSYRELSARTLGI